MHNIYVCIVLVWAIVKVIGLVFWFYCSLAVIFISVSHLYLSLSLSIYLFIFLFNPFVIKFPIKFSCILFMVMHLCLCLCEWVSALEMTVVVVMKKHNDSFLNCVMIQSVDFEVFTWVAQLKIFSSIMFFRTNLLLALRVPNNIVAVKMNIDIDIHVKQTFIEHKSNLILCICIRVWLCVCVCVMMWIVKRGQWKHHSNKMDKFTLYKDYFHKKEKAKKQQIPIQHSNKISSSSSRTVSLFSFQWFWRTNKKTYACSMYSIYHPKIVVQKIEIISHLW